MRTRRLLGAPALAVTTLLALTACMRVDLDVTLQPDDTMDGTMLLALSADLAQELGVDADTLDEVSPADILGPDAQLEGATTEPYDDGDFIGSRVHFEGEELTVLGSGQGQEGLDVVREGDEFVVSGTVDLTPEALGPQQVPADVEDLDVRIAVTFPGEVREHNGVEQEGTTVIWSPSYGERTDIAARGSAEPGAEQLPVWAAILLLLLALVVVGLVIVLVARNGRRRPAEAGARPTTGEGAGATAASGADDSMAGSPTPSVPAFPLSRSSDVPPTQDPPPGPASAGAAAPVDAEEANTPLPADEPRPMDDDPR